MPGEMPIIFVSYAHADNQSPPPRKKGTITRFIECLQVVARIKYGKELEVWSDRDLVTGVKWEPEIYKKLSACRVFIPILSPSWVQSKWGRREWEAVWKRAEAEKNLGNQGFILPVRYEWDAKYEEKLFALSDISDEQKETLRQALTLQSPLQFEFGIDSNRLNGIARLLGATVKEILEQSRPQAAVPSHPDRPKIYLGFAFSAQMREWRTRISNELKVHEYEVYEAERDWLTSEQEVRQGIDTQLRDALGMVYFLDRQPAPGWAGSNLSPLDVELAAGKAKSEDPSHVASGRPFGQWSWTGFLNLDSFDPPAYRDFVNSKAISQPVGAFAKWLLDELDKLRNPVPKYCPPAPPVWLIHESGDRAVIEDIQNYLTERNCVVLFPGEGVEQGLVPAKYNEDLKKNEYFLFYWGSGTKEWADNTCNRFKRARLTENAETMEFKPPAVALWYLGARYKRYKEELNPWPGAQPVRKWDNPKYDKVILDQFVGTVFRHFKAAKSKAASAH